MPPQSPSGKTPGANVRRRARAVKKFHANPSGAIKGLAATAKSSGAKKKAPPKLRLVAGRKVTIPKLRKKVKKPYRVSR